MSVQSEMAVTEADVCLFVIDARAGVTSVDREFAARLRRSGKPIILIANKAEGNAAQSGVLESYALGLGDPITVSGEHGEGMDALYEALKSISRGRRKTKRLTRRRRSGLHHRPAQFRQIDPRQYSAWRRADAHPRGGITRDAIALDWEWNGKPIKLWDTAGIRRKSRVTGKLEKLAVADALRAIRFADAVIVLVDASQEIERQDLALAISWRKRAGPSSSP